MWESANLNGQIWSLVMLVVQQHDDHAAQHVNTYNAAGVSRRQDQTGTNFKFGKKCQHSEIGLLYLESL